MTGLSKRRWILILVAAFGLLAAVGLWLAPNLSFLVGSHDDTIEAQTADGRLRFHMPANWVTAECPSGAADCVTVGPADTAFDDRVSVVLTEHDPQSPEGGAHLLFFQEGWVTADTPGVQLLAVDGRRAVRTGYGGQEMLIVLLDDGASTAMVMCPNQTLSDGCETVMNSLRITF